MLLLNASILFSFLQLLLSDVGWQFPPEGTSGSADLASHPLKSLERVKPASPGEMLHCVGEGTLKEQITREMWVWLGKIALCAYVGSLAEEMSRAEVKIHQDEIGGNYKVQ